MTIALAPISIGAATHAVEQWHYSRTLPRSPSTAFGVWEDERYIGAVIFGRGASWNLGLAYGVTKYECCELVRVALNTHRAPVSHIVPEAVRRVAGASAGLRVVFSFADPAHGHHGGIYQAMNWLYLGETAPGVAWRQRSTGRLLHNRIVSTSGIVTVFGRKVRAVRRDECERVELPGKHRYALALDKPMRRQLMRLALPYPQARGRGVEGDTPGVLLGDAGSTPADRST